MPFGPKVSVFSRLLRFGQFDFFAYRMNTVTCIMMTLSLPRCSNEKKLDQDDLMRLVTVHVQVLSSLMFHWSIRN